MKKQLVNLLPENEMAIDEILKHHPELRTTTGVIRYALGRTLLELQTDKVSKSDELIEVMSSTVQTMRREQSVINILLLSIMETLKIETTPLDPLNGERMQQAKKVLSQHLNSLQRDKRHGGRSSWER